MPCFRREKYRITVGEAGRSPAASAVGCHELTGNWGRLADGPSILSAAGVNFCAGAIASIDGELHFSCTDGEF